MTQVAEPIRRYRNSFSGLASSVSGQGWLAEMRRSGIEQFERLGFPTTDQEAWRLTNVAAIAQTAFVPTTQPAALDHPAIRSFGFGDAAQVELVFINGRYVPSLSRIPRLARDVRIMSLPEALEREPDSLRKHLGRYARLDQNPFVALNTGFIQDGAVIHLPRGTTMAGPIHLLFLSLPGDRPTVSHPRVLVIAEENVEASIVETYAGDGEGEYFTNAVTEIVAGQDCRLDHCKLQQETLEAFHVATMQVQLGAGAQLVSHSASLGSKLTRNDLNILLNGERADATLNGLVVIGGDQHVDNHTLLRHEKPNCPSHELYKHVLDGKSRCVFNGQIFVQQDAQKTDSKQTSKSLLLSDEAQMNSQPALEIYADDVKCTHGSTTGPVDEEMIFYLRSRGVGLDAARHLLTYAFAADITRRIKVEPVRRRLEDFMAAQHGLPQDLRITDLGSHDEAAR